MCGAQRAIATCAKSALLETQRLSPTLLSRRKGTRVCAPLAHKVGVGATPSRSSSSGSRQPPCPVYLALMRITTACLVLLSLSLPAKAAEFPIYDVERECGAAYGGSGNAAVAACIRREQPSYDVARYAWEEIAPEAQERCRQTADQATGGPHTLGRHAFYSILSNCLRGALETQTRRRDAAQPPRFRY